MFGNTTMQIYQMGLYVVFATSVVLVWVHSDERHFIQCLFLHFQIKETKVSKV